MKLRQQHRGKHLTITVAAMAVIGQVSAGDNLPSLGDDVSPWRVDVTYENHTARRENVGLAKFRNTLQVEADRSSGDGWGIHSTLRGSFDGVYQMNKSQYGKDAGGPIQLENRGLGMAPFGPGGALVPAGSANPTVAHGFAGGAVNLAGASAATFANNPNEGLRVLGDRWHQTEGGVAFGVPVRPCDTDPRGCRDFGGYGKLDQRELESPEFNDRFDFIRELYAKKTFGLADGKDLFLKIGKQQVVWGRTDLFRVLDVINPVDYSRNNIYDELSEIRIPMWIAQAEYRMGASESMQDRNLQLIWNFDKFRPNNLGQCGTPNVILDAGCFFRGMANLWDNGGTVANFVAAPGIASAANFGPGQIGIRKVHLPEWSLANTQIGGKFEGVTKDGLNFSLNALHYRSQLPSLHAFGGKETTINPATGAPDYSKKLIAFDMHFPRVNLLGGSLDFQVPAVGAAVRMEGAMTWGEEFANSTQDDMYSKNRVFRSVIGVDRPTFIPFISESSATLISAQLFYQHIYDHQEERSTFGKIGMPDWKDNFIATLLFKGFMKSGTVSPQLLFAHDFQAGATAVSPQLEWNVSNDLKLTFGANYKLTAGRDNWKFDDCRACAPFAQFAGPGQAVGQNLGAGGFEPLGRFRAGPIGAAFKENDIYFKLGYKF
jgi:hypothetical protein